jgi:uncharacterized protein involved in copper resistance
MTFESEGYANWLFLLQVIVAGDGSTATNMKMEYQMVLTHPILTQPSHSMTRLTDMLYKKL